MITYKLDGIPDDYDNYFYYVEDNSVDSLTKTIEKVLALPEQERTSFGKKARDFVINEKNNYKAGKKIIDMILKSSSK